MENKTKAQVTQELIDSLGKASGACSQLVHTHGHPGFIIMRESLDLTKEGVTANALAAYGMPKNKALV